MSIILIGIAVAIIIGLAAYAWSLQRRLKMQGEQQKIQAQEELARQQQQISEATRGIRVLATALLREELTLTEGSMRIAYLLTQLDESASEKQDYAVFFQLASATSHIPVLDGWKALTKQQRSAYTKERIETEAAFAEFVTEAIQTLLQDPLLK